MYAVIRTGGKQYRVSPGDVLVVEKLAGEPGDELRFADVLMMGDGDDVSIGAPLIDGAAVSAVLVETRKGEKIKVFKKIRRQGYRRTKGHRQMESVLRVIGVEGGGKSAKWDGAVDLTPRAVLVARARNLAPRDAPTLGVRSDEGVSADIVVTDTDGPPVIEATVVERYAPDTVLSSESSDAAPTETAKPKKAPKAAAAESDDGPLVEQPVSETVEGEPQSVAAEDAAPAKAAPRKAAPKKAAAEKTPAKTAAPKKAAPKKAAPAAKTDKKTKS